MDDLRPMLPLTLDDGRRLYVRADNVEAVEEASTEDRDEFPNTLALIELSNGITYYVRETADAVRVLMETKPEATDGQ